MTQKIPDSLLGGTGVLRGNPDVKYTIAGCALRRDTSLAPDWMAVSDSAHIPINLVSVAASSVDINVTYQSETEQKIGTFMVVPDERFAADGVAAGGSVAADNANVSLGAPCSFYVDLDASNAIVFDTKFFDASRFGVSVAGSGAITVTHPQRRLMQLPLVQHTSGGSLFEALTVHYVNTSSPGITSLFLVGQAKGLISYNGSAWTLSSSPDWSISDLTVSYNATLGELTVTHPTLLGSPGLGIVPWYNGEMLSIAQKSVTSSGFVCAIRKASDNSIPALSSALGIYFDRGVSAIRKTPTGRLHFFLGHVQVNCNHVDYPNGNLWFLSVMQQNI